MKSTRRILAESIAALSLIACGCASKPVVVAPVIQDDFTKPLPRGQVTYMQTFPDGTRGGASYTVRGQK